MDLTKTIKIEKTTSLDDWHVIRECYVHSFRRYPLYKYMVPDDSKRDDFLRAYLDANYEVTVGSGQGILLAIRVPDLEAPNFDNNNNNCSNLRRMKVIGGVVFLPPSAEGGGWAIGSDEPYWEAYEKHGLAEISKEGLERVMRYEAWENEHVGQKASATRIPLWNGLFCAICPEYACKGLGSTVYKEAIRIMAKHWVKQQETSQRRRHRLSIPGKTEAEGGIITKLVRSISLSQLHRYTLLNHRALPQAAFMQKSQQNTKANACVNQATRNVNLSVRDMMFNPLAPLVVAISHSDRAAHFHQSNGFQPISRIPFYDEVEDVTPFYTHVMVLDPFRTGRVKEITTGLQRDVKTDENFASFKLYDNLAVSQPDKILIE